MTTENKKAVNPKIRGTKVRQSEMPFRHDADVFRPNGVSRRNFGGLKPPNPSSFGVRGVIGKKAEVQNPNRVSAKCAIIANCQLQLKKMCALDGDEIPIEQKNRVLLLPACLRGCFSVPAYPLGAY